MVLGLGFIVLGVVVFVLGLINNSSPSLRFGTLTRIAVWIISLLTILIGFELIASVII